METICNFPVQVVWVSHRNQPEPFLGLRCEDADGVIAALKACLGKPVELSFTPRR